MYSPQLAYLEHASAHGLPFVSYRMPESHTQITLIFDDNAVQPVTNYAQLSGKSGFIFTPFDTDKHPGYFITPEEILEGDKGFRADLFRKEKKTPSSHLIEKDESRANYEKQFERMHALLQNDELQKIILSRTLTLSFPKEQHPYAYLNLSANYPNAMTYWIHLPHLGIQWMGATPELLLSEEQATLQTLALAGTKKADETWTQKEKEEQQMVVDYISEQLREFTPQIAPKQTVDTGAVQHLATRFSLPKSSSNFFNIIKKLHPTPAICGLPKNKAFQTIQKIEQRDRKYYCGFLGPINIANTTATFVNLRCMELTSNTARLYVGGGLTKDSNLEREWQETERKAATLKKFLI